METGVSETEGTPWEHGVLKVKKLNHFKEENIFTLLNAAEGSRKMRSEN